MIIFYNKQTGNIVGTIEGRVHTEQHLKMWVGSEKENDRVVINWTPIEGGEYEPQHEQKILIRALSEGKKSIRDYKIDTNTKKIVKIK